MGSSIRLVNAITGSVAVTNVTYFITFNEFKKFVAQRWNIPTDQLLILLPFGHKLSQFNFSQFQKDIGKEVNQNITTTDFYVFDRRLFSIAGIPKDIIEGDEQEDENQKTLIQYFKDSNCIIDKPSIIKPLVSPLVESTLSNISYNKIISLLTTNLGWLSALEIDVFYLQNFIQDTTNEIKMILTCLTVCDQYLNLYSHEVQKLYDSNSKFLNQLASNDISLKWKQCYNNYLPKLNGLNGPLVQYIDKQKFDANDFTLKTLNSKISKNLTNVKDSMMANETYKIKITNNIARFNTKFIPDASKYSLEDQMLEKFKVLVNGTRSKSREIIDKESNEFTKDYVDEVEIFLQNQKNEVSSNLFTISKALFTEAEEIITLKKNLQINSIKLLGQIAFTQLKILNIKKTLIHDCNRDLKIYQKIEIELSEAEDLPILYGLYLIENYRRNHWLLQVLTNSGTFSKYFNKIIESEKLSRSKWLKVFGVTTSMFVKDIKSNANFKLLESVCNLNADKIENEILNLRSSLHDFLTTINNFLKQLAEFDTNKEIISVLTKRLIEAKSLEIHPNSFSSESLELSESTEVKNYKLRIKKLESLLHQVRYSNINQWPSGMLNPNSMNHFRNSLPAIDTSAYMNVSSVPDLSSDYIIKTKELQKNITDLEVQLKLLTDQNEQQLSNLKIKSDKLVDLGLEKDAYREALTNLNSELNRMTILEETHKKSLFQKEADFKEQIDHIISENKRLLKTIDDNIEHEKNIVVEKDIIEKELAKYRELKDDYAKESEKIKSSLEECQNTIKDRDLEIESLRKENERLHNEIIEKRTDKENEDVSNAYEGLQNIDQDLESGKVAAVEDDTAMVTYDGTVESKEDIVKSSHPCVEEGTIEKSTILRKLFELFKINIFILENIGLLLTSGRDGTVDIKRVKGLRKGSLHSVLDDSMMLGMDTNNTIHSDVFQRLEELYDSLKSKPDDVDIQNKFMSYFDKLFTSKLYEDAVIRRFKDVESLAKKLTKENKTKKTLVERLKGEKISLRNFQVGDLALFLPTRDNHGSVASSISSLNSSFSSVDLSTPPPNESAETKLKVKLAKRKQSPWAAFTAFESDNRYFFKDSGTITKDKEWFVGRITAIQKFTVDDSNENPFKLSKGSDWFQVTADLVTFDN